jgi:hypothetical protein
MEEEGCSGSCHRRSRIPVSSVEQGPEVVGSACVASRVPPRWSRTWRGCRVEGAGLGNGCGTEDTDVEKALARVLGSAAMLGSSFVPAPASAGEGGGAQVRAGRGPAGAPPGPLRRAVHHGGTALGENRSRGHPPAGSELSNEPGAATPVVRAGQADASLTARVNPRTTDTGSPLPVTAASGSPDSVGTGRTRNSVYGVGFGRHERRGAGLTALRAGLSTQRHLGVAWVRFGNASAAKKSSGFRSLVSTDL